MISIKVGDIVFSCEVDWSSLLEETDFISTPKETKGIWLINGEKVSKGKFGKRWDEEKSKNSSLPCDVKYIYPCIRWLK